MRSARVIVGPHGAGLTNLVFAPKPGVVIEVIPAYWYSDTKSAFRVLAQIAGHNYCAVVSHDTNPQTMDWKIDVDAVVAVARRFL
jgi:capsular polysaccharide biosynthesis protein